MQYNIICFKFHSLLVDLIQEHAIDFTVGLFTLEAWGWSSVRLMNEFIYSTQPTT